MDVMKQPNAYFIGINNGQKENVVCRNHKSVSLPFTSPIASDLWQIELMRLSMSPAESCPTPVEELSQLGREFGRQNYIHPELSETISQTSTVMPQT